MNTRAYAAEFLGTFALALGVSLAVANDFPLVPLVAALTVGVFVYTIGGLSGAQLNPAVTLALWSVKKMKTQDALMYIVVQLIAGLVALVFTALLTGIVPTLNMSLSWMVALGELLGAFILVFGISSVVWTKVKSDDAGLVIGGSLLLGILLASNFSDGILNPAVGLALGVLSPMYILGALIGGTAGAWTYQWLMGK